MRVSKTGRERVNVCRVQTSIGVSDCMHNVYARVCAYVHASLSGLCVCGGWVNLSVSENERDS